MSSRAHAVSLVLTNWRGVFYERYQLDRHVTALEGANGSGKTTVMIAAHLVLLPDLARLRFTNLGESGATGGDRGIFGRLGESGAPSYAILEFASERHSRLLAGVQLVRKGEPSVELSTFVVTDLRPELKLQDILLLTAGGREQVPEMAELNDSVARAAGRLTAFSSAKEYLGTLFEHGITPLRLAADEERAKLNEMLRTSMTGGISRTLTNDLRSFLLRPEAGLGETLVVMRGNLEACRRTRTEVQSARVLQTEIHGVYEAGEAMFAAALHSSRERAAEMRRTADRAQVEHTAVARALAEATLLVSKAQQAQSTVDARLDGARRERDATATVLEKTTRARAVVVKIEGLETEATRAGARFTEAERAARESELRRAQALEARRRADDDWTQTARGLAEVQKGVDDLHRRAAGHRRVSAELARAGGVRAGFEAHLVIATEARAAQTREAAQIEREIDTAEHRRTEHARAVVALERVAGEALDPATYHVRAKSELARVDAMSTLVARMPAIEEQIRSERSNAAAQAKARTLAKELGLAEGSEPGPVRVDRALTAANEARAALEQQRREDEHQADAAARAARDGRAQVTALSRRAAEWREAQALVAQLGGSRDASADGPVDLDGIDKTLRDERDALVPAIASAERERDAATRGAADLERRGGAVPRDLIRICDAVGGELLASRYDDVAPQDAGAMQALLGPLAQAIVVDDARAAANLIAGRPRDVASVLLLEGAQSIDTAPLGHMSGVDVIVESFVGLRVESAPELPTLGRRARAARVVELNARAGQSEAERQMLRAALAGNERQRGVVALLRERIDVLRLGDPAEALLQAEREVATAVRVESEARARARAALQPIAERSARAHQIQSLLSDARFLDPPDHAERLARLEEERAAAIAARAEITRIGAARELLAELRDELRTSPPDAASVALLAARLTSILAERERSFETIEALTYVRDHQEALAWDDAEPRLRSERALIPELEGAERDARARREAASTAVSTAEAEWSDRVRDLQDARAELLDATMRRDGARRDLIEIGAGEPTARDVDQAASRALQADGAHAVVQQERDVASALAARRESEAGMAAEREAEKRTELETSQREAVPHEDRWERIQAAAQSHRVLAATQTRERIEAFTGKGSPNLSTYALQEASRLLERLRRAQRASEVTTRLERWVNDDRERAVEGYLDLWLMCLEWVRRRLPANIAEVDDPNVALRRLGEELVGLEERLHGQEAILRGKSEDVASHIEVQIRKAVGQVQRLSRNLDGLRFGSIAAIRVRLRHLEPMSRILRALREGGQDELFDPGLPLEEALERLFSRHGGGAGSGGQKVLDFREYIELHAEVKRLASAEWEPASPTKLSTGEAIGVGAAVMMVVLAEWERDANLLRGKRSEGSLRFLFLDEANRLDRRNLDELFDLCQKLELQLLIAAPEVARADGTTTYRLQRILEGNLERVAVSGRRTIAS